MPGLGLLLLRATLGITAIVQVGVYLNAQNDSTVLLWTLGILTIAGGILLLIGLLTPLISVLTLLIGVIAAVSFFPSIFQNQPESGLSIIYIIMIAVALVLLGPGAYSLDARMFGRREIVIPHNPREPKS